MLESPTPAHVWVVAYILDRLEVTPAEAVLWRGQTVRQKWREFGPNGGPEPRGDEGFADYWVHRWFYGDGPAHRWRWLRDGHRRAVPASVERDGTLRARNEFADGSAIVVQPASWNFGVHADCQHRLHSPDRAYGAVPGQPGAWCAHRRCAAVRVAREDWREGALKAGGGGEATS